MTAMPHTACSLIRDAIDCVAREAPAAHARMRTALGPRAIELALGDGTLQIRLDDAASSPPTIAARTSVDTLCALLAGELDLLEGVESLRLDVIGDADDLIAAGEAMTWFLQGAVRCLSIEPLADQLFALRNRGVS